VEPKRAQALLAHLSKATEELFLHAPASCLRICI
jgi:hypothetical protein